MGNRPNVCKHNCPKIHKGQHQQGRRGIWKGFTHLVSKKIDTIFTNKAWETLTAGKRQSALACPFLNVVDTAGGARLVLHGLGDTRGWGGQGGSPNCCPISVHQLKLRALLTLEPHPGHGEFWPAVLKIRNSKFPQNVTKEGVQLLLNSWKWLLPQLWAGGATQHLCNKTCPFFSLSA